MKRHILPQIPLLICLLITFNTIKSYGQEFEKRTVFVKKIDAKIQLDGVLNEPIWDEAEKAEDFWQIFPTDSLRATNKTVVNLIYFQQSFIIKPTSRLKTCFATFNNFVFYVFCLKSRFLSLIRECIAEKS